MQFSLGAKEVALDRQDRNDGLGSYCAKCCDNLGLFDGYAIPRIPITKGGTMKGDNCVILCEKCFLEIGENHTGTIPYSELPCFNVSQR